MTTVAQLKAKIDKGKADKFYIFTGPEKAVMNKYIKQIDPDVRTVTSFTELMTRLSSGSLFFKSQTYLLVNDKGTLEQDVEVLIKYIGANRVILVYDTIDARKKFFKKAEKHIVTFDKYTPEQLVQFITKLMPDIPSKIAKTLAVYCNNDVSRIEMEVDKLKRLETEVTDELLKDIVFQPPEDRIFDMIDAVASRKAPLAFSLYDDLMELGESPIKLVSLLYTKFKQVYLVQTYYKMTNIEIAGKTGMSPYQVNYARDLCGNFALDRLVRILRNIQEMEVRMKTGQVDVNLGMDYLLINIIE